MPSSSTATTRRKPAGAPARSAPRKKSGSKAAAPRTRNISASRQAPARSSGAPWIVVLALLVIGGGMAAGVVNARHDKHAANVHIRKPKKG